MTPYWTFGHLSDSDIISEIEQGSERVTLIVGLAFIDDRLTQAIEASLRHVGPDTLQKWFGERGFYRDFQAKADFALMLSIIGKITYGDLMLLGRARNEVAHKSRTRAFQSATIKGFCRDLRLPERLGAGVVWTNKKDPKERFMFVVSKITDLLGVWTYAVGGRLGRRRKPAKKARLP